MEYKTKKEQRDLIRRVIELRKEEIKNFEDLIINLLKDDIKIANEVLRGTAPIQKFYKHTQIINKRIKDIFNK